MPPEPVPIRPEDLLEHAAWLRRLARSLVGDASDPDDLVQETWISALRRLPRGDLPIRPWLAEVLRNLVRMRIRGERRRARREDATEALHETDAAPSPETLLDRVQTQRLLTELVVGLPDPIRGAVLLRYYEGLSAAEIARVQGIPAGTVRWRLKVGLDQLREALDQKSGGDRRSWCLLLAPLALPRASLGLGFLKSLWMTTRTLKIGSASALALASLAGLLLWRAGHPPSAITPAPAIPFSTSTPEARGRRGSRGSDVAAVPPSPAAADEDADAIHGSFEGRVINWSTGRGVDGAQVSFFSGGTTTAVSTNAEGAFRFRPSTEGRHTLALVTAPRYLPFAPDLGQSSIELHARAATRIRDITVYLRPAIDHTAVVVTPDGKPVAGAAVALLGAEEGEQALQPLPDRFTSNAQGEVVFHAPDDAILEARHPGYGTGRSRLDGPAAVAHRLTIHLRNKGDKDTLGSAHIAGRVVDPAGLAVPGALVSARPDDDTSRDPRPSKLATADAEGRFVVEGLDQGIYSLAATFGGRAPAVAAGIGAGTNDLVLKLRRGGALTGRVLGEAGEPIAAFTIVVTRTGSLETTAIASPSFLDAEGRFEIADLAPGAYRVLATAQRHAPSADLEATVPEPPADGTPIELRLTRGGALTGKVVSATGGAPLELARVSVDGVLGSGSWPRFSACCGTSAVPISATTVTDAQGEFEIAGVAAGVRTITVAAYGHHLRMISGIRFVEGRRQGPMTIDLPPTQEGEEPHLELVGVGLVMRATDGSLRVDKVIAGGGAEEAGIGVGDELLAVDGAAVAELGFDGSMQRVRGPEGTAVRLTVRKAGTGTLVEVVVSRRRIHA